MSSDPFVDARHRMVERQIRRRGVTDAGVLEAMAAVPRHLFVPEDHRHLAYEDSALPIDANQTISQPYMVAAMTEALEPSPNSRVLEVGTGSGYQTAVLAEIVEAVYTIERVPELAEAARAILDDLGYDNVAYHIGDGSRGWPDEAPFDGVLVTAAAAAVPDPLLRQLTDGGRLVIPVGGPPDQDLYQIRREGNSYERRFLTRCRFVPLVEGE